jgi:hypothetical protein
VEEWEELEMELKGVQLTEEEDSVRWMLTPHGQFTTSSLYRFCTFPGVRNLKIEEMWRSKLHLKVKNFIWLVIRNRIQTVDNLGRKKWKGSKLCNEEESVNHLLFRCPIAVFMWVVVKDGTEWSERPRSLQEMIVMWFLLGAICWTLWLNRNDFAFNNLLISSPRAIIFRLISFLQHWMVTVRTNRSALERVTEAIRAHVPMELMATGVR